MVTNYTTILNNSQYKSMANAIRIFTIDAVQKANSGHPGMPMGMADVVSVLYSEFLDFMPNDPKWPNRDRLILSAGHGSMLLYSLFYLLGYKDISLDDIKSFRQIHSKAAGHPEYGLMDGIEMTTGPLGQGIASAVGMAISEKKLQENFGAEIVNHKTYVICGDGCLMEGISHEAISLAGHLSLNKLIVLFDDNNISIDGPTSLSCSDDHLKRFEASGWNVNKINGHNQDEIRAALFKAGRSDKPSFIACRTKIGFGSPKFENSEKCHGAPLGDLEIEATRKNLNFNYPSFELPEEILNLWRSRYLRCDKKYQEWKGNSNNEFMNFMRNSPSYDFINLKKEISAQKEAESTRKSSGKILNQIADNFNLLIGSADLSESNNLKDLNSKIITKDSFIGNFLHYGIREHLMVAIMNGISLYGGYIPCGGSFLVFTDYARPAIRLAALMNRKIILIMTHDSIGVGEDGPTHQPIEHLASLRAIPNLYVFRPADKIECLESWENALLLDNPSVFCLSRQNLPQIREFSEENLVKKGAYIIKDTKNASVTIFASGSELQIALDAADKLFNMNIKAKVISVVCWELFEKMDKQYKEGLLENNTIKVAIEAAGSFGWEKFIGRDGIFIGMNEFGLSGPSNDLFEYFKITSNEVVKRVTNKIGEKK